MKVSSSSASTGFPAGGARRAAAPGFAPTGGATPATAAGASSAASAVAGLDALLILQDAEDTTSRRRRAVRRAGGLLDHLEALKLAVLGEGDAGEALARLQRAVCERRAEVEQGGLADVLDAVETRAAVELAKRDRLLGQAA